MINQQFNIQESYALPTLYLCVSYLSENCYLCHLQHKLIGFHNPDEKCLLRGTNWVLNYSSLCFVFKGLMHRTWDTLNCAFYCVHRSSPADLTHSQVNPVHIPTTPSVLHIHCNITLPSTPTSPKWSISHFPTNIHYVFLITAMRATCTATLYFGYSNNI